MNMNWSIPSTPRRRPRMRFGRAMSAFFWCVCALAALAVHNNVMADDSALNDRMRALACEQAGGDSCQIVRMVGKRSILESHTQFEIEGGGMFDVVCRREALVVGEHTCHVR